MASTRCPDCDALVGISPTRERQHPTRGTSMWWRVDVHKHPNRPELCDGSGKKV